MPDPDSDEPYVRFPGAKKHHLCPKTRGGPDHEYNLFPWNNHSETSWHKIFGVLTVREVWGVLDDAWLLIFQSQTEFIVPEWRAPLALPGQLGGPLKPVEVARLRLWWRSCFGSTDLASAHRLIRYMMLFMVFGRYADCSQEMFSNRRLRQVLEELPTSGDRAWAFRTCFHGLPHTVTLRHIKKMIRRVRTLSRSIPIH